MSRSTRLRTAWAAGLGLPALLKTASEGGPKPAGSMHHRDDRLGEDPGVDLGIFGDVIADGLEVLDGLRRPNQTSHFLRRVLTLAWGMP